MIKKKIKKPWGYEVLIEKNTKYMFKKLFMKKDHRCSLQLHKKKIETIFVVSGSLKIFYGKNKNKLNHKIFKTQDTITINPKTIHRMQAVSDCVYLEASTPEINDVVRLSDDYKRKVVNF
jgi:mannose-6-phosphate isomerase-like protein (cupin superfamily)